MNLATRAARVEAAQTLRAEGLLLREIAERLGVAVSTVSAYLNDPNGSQAAVRHDRARGTCTVCGEPTSWPSGGKPAPTMHARCRPRVGHGARTRYNGGCRCDLCRAGHREAMREYRRQKREQAA